MSLCVQTTRTPKVVFARAPRAFHQTSSSLVPPSSPYHTPGSLKFSCHTNASTAPTSSSNRLSLSPSLPGASHHSATDSETMLTDAAPPSGSGQFSPTHTYPPAPTSPMRARKLPRLRASSMRSSINSLMCVSQSPSSPKPILPPQRRCPPPRVCSRERFVR